MEYRFIDLSKTLGKATKAYLRTVSGYKRLPANQIDDLVFANNLQYEEQQKQKEERKKQTKSAVAELPQYIEQSEQVQKQIKAERKREQKQQAIKQFEDRLAKNIL